MTIKERILYWHLQAIDKEIYSFIFFICTICFIFTFLGLFLWAAVDNCWLFLLSPIVILIYLSALVTIVNKGPYEFIRQKDILSIDFYDDVLRLKKQIKILKAIRYIKIL